jgi:hypothetical protein
VCACVFEGGRVEGEVSSVVGGVKEFRAVRMAPQHSSSGSNTLSHTRTWQMRGRSNMTGGRKGYERRKNQEEEKKMRISARESK